MFDAGGDASRWRTPASTTDVTSLMSRRLIAAPDEQEQDAERGCLGERVQAGEHVGEPDDAERREQDEQRADQREELADHVCPPLDEAGDHPVADGPDQRDGDERREERPDRRCGRRGSRSPPIPTSTSAVERDDAVGERRSDAQPVR